MATTEPAQGNPKQRPDKESALFVRYYDLLLWLTERTRSFPRELRFVLAERILDTAYACYGHLVRAKKVNDAARPAVLLEADIRLDVLRAQLRLAHEMRCLSTDQYEHGARLVNEVGKMLGAWRAK
jgi:hypothetical protein